MKQELENRMLIDSEYDEEEYHVSKHGRDEEVEQDYSDDDYERRREFWDSL